MAQKCVVLSRGRTTVQGGAGCAVESGAAAVKNGATIDNAGLVAVVGAIVGCCFPGFLLVDCFRGRLCRLRSQPTSRFDCPFEFEFGVLRGLARRRGTASTS